MDGDGLGREDCKMTKLIWNNTSSCDYGCVESMDLLQMYQREPYGDLLCRARMRSEGSHKKKKISLFDRTESRFLSGFRVRKHPWRSSFIAELACLTLLNSWLEVCSQPYNIIFGVRYCFSSRTKEPLMTPINQCNSHLHLFITFHTQYVIHYTSH